VTAVAKLRFESKPSSFSCGTKSPFLSVHGRVADKLNPSGFRLAANSVPATTTYRLNVPFSAVLPFPNRSYAIPIRGERSFQSGAFSTPGQVCAGAYGFGPVV